MSFLRLPWPTTADREVARPRCDTCQRPIAPGTSSVVFPAHHSRCIERSLARARSDDASWD
jgi:hypothetical protein